MSELELIIVSSLVLIGAFWLAGLSWWALFFVGTLGFLALIEAYLWNTRRETLSSQFWKFREQHPDVADLLLLMIVFFIALVVVHLRA